MKFKSYWVDTLVDSLLFGSERCMWLLKETIAADVSKSTKCTYIAHLVEVSGFLWNDNPENNPPRCHTCPKNVNGCIPCIGILVLLSNLPPLINEVSVTSWQKGKGLLRPEIFHPRWRVDRDPTRFLEKYSPPVPQKTLNSCPIPLQPTQAIMSSTLSNQYASNMQRIAELDELPKHLALHAVKNLMQQMDRIVAKHEFDAMLVKTSQASTMCTTIC